MPQYKTTYNILVDTGGDELFESKWMDGDTPYIPPTRDWDYKREMRIDDVDIWECLVEASGGIGIYAAHSPFAEFYLITTGWDFSDPTYHDKHLTETYYGPNAQTKVFARAKQMGLNLATYDQWAEPDELWLHDNVTQPLTRYNS